MPFEDITANGALGDARQASAEIGTAIVEAVVARACTFLEAFIRSTARAEEPAR